MILHQSGFPLCLISSEGFRNNKDAVIGAIIQSLSFAKSKVTSVLLFLNRLSNNARSIGSSDVAKSCGFKS